MDLHDAIIDSEAASSLSKDDGISEIWWTTSLLGVDSHHSQLFPDLLGKNIKAQLHMDRDAGVERVL
jgi:hypothetical protein